MVKPGKFKVLAPPGEAHTPHRRWKKCHRVGVPSRACISATERQPQAEGPPDPGPYGEAALGNAVQSHFTQRSGAFLSCLRLKTDG